MSDILAKIFGLFLFYGMLLGAAIVGVIWLIVWLFN